MKTKSLLKLSEVLCGNFIIQVDPIAKKNKRKSFFVKKIAEVSEKKIYGFFLDELIEDPSKLIEKITSSRIIFNEDFHPTSKYFVRPTKKRIKKIKGELRNIIENKKSTIKENDVYLLQYIIGKMNPIHKYGVIFRDKSEFQKDDCVTSCGSESTQEAVHKDSRVRCCEKPACEKYAAEIAKLI